jgi:peptidoglycan/LPS O-acetylase OafA/YrhL
MSSAPLRASLRQDIQALRGYAVLIVVLYHAGLAFTGGGFLGVDVFFVISGYLITRLIANAMARGEFTFAWFYYRRARRLLPAAYVTFAAVAVAAPFFLGATELLDFRGQLVGAIAFAENIVLWRQAGYFEGAAELKPLLHVWSLSLEEQYYFLLPALMFFLPRRWWRGAAIVLAVGSLVLCLWLVQRKAIATFYLLPTRGWELALGSIAALLPPGERWARAMRVAFWPALAAMLLVPAWRLSGVHPGPDALLVCLATAIVILRRHPWLEQGPALRPLAYVGDISYSLYLVHWPLFAFLHNVWMGEGGVEAPLSWRVGLALASFPLAAALHRWVEEPWRHAPPEASRLRFAGVFAACSLALVAGSFVLTALSLPARDYAHERRPNHGLDASCISTGRFEPLPACRTSAMPDTLVWGDSYAMHLVGAVAQSRQVVQATRNACAPLLGLAPMERLPKAGYDRGWAADCIAYNDSVLDYLRRTPSVRTVVVSSIFEQMLDDANFSLLEREPGGGLRPMDAAQAPVQAALARTVAQVRALGRQVVLVAPPPKGGFDMGTCVERLQSGLPVLGVAADCSISPGAYLASNEPVVRFVRDAAARADVGLIDFEACLCREGSCRTTLGDVLVYADGGHFSHAGAVQVAETCGIAQSIAELAR